LGLDDRRPELRLRVRSTLSLWSWSVEPALSFRLKGIFAGVALTKTRKRWPAQPEPNALLTPGRSGYCLRRRVTSAIVAFHFPQLVGDAFVNRRIGTEAVMVQVIVAGFRRGGLKFCLHVLRKRVVRLLAERRCEWGDCQAKSGDFQEVMNHAIVSIYDERFPATQPHA
jgi:hypothetical protein